MTSFGCIIYHCKPALNRQTYLNQGETDTVLFIVIPLRLPLKIIPLAISVSLDKLLNDFMSTGLVDRLYSSYNVLALNPKNLVYYQQT